MDNERLLRYYLNPLMKQNIEQFELFDSFLKRRLPYIEPDQMVRIELLAESLRHTSRLLQVLVKELCEEKK